MTEPLRYLCKSFFSQLNIYNINYLDRFLYESINKLPIKHSMVAYIVLIKCLKYHLNQEQLNLKTLYLEMSCSEIATREQLLKLHRDGWLLIETCADDKRVKYIKPTAKLIENSNLIIRNSSPLNFAKPFNFS